MKTYLYYLNVIFEILTINIFRIIYTKLLIEFCIKKSKKTITSFSEKFINRIDILIEIKNVSIHF